MDHIDVLRQSMQQTKQHHPFSIDAIVILPDYIQTIWTLPKNDSDYSKRWILIKSRAVGCGKARTASIEINTSAKAYVQRNIYVDDYGLASGL